MRKTSMLVVALISASLISHAVFADEITEPLTHAQLETFVPNYEEDHTKIVVNERLRNEPKNTEIQCLAENIYHEAGNQSVFGKVGVGMTTLNRAMHNSLWPSTVCGVVKEKRKIGNKVSCQFSWVCDKKKQLMLALKAFDPRQWAESLSVATDLLHSNKYESLKKTKLGKVHYFNNGNVAPFPGLTKVMSTGDLSFYE